MCVREEKERRHRVVKGREKEKKGKEKEKKSGRKERVKGVAIATSSTDRRGSSSPHAGPLKEAMDGCRSVNHP